MWLTWRYAEMSERHKCAVHTCLTGYLDGLRTKLAFDRCPHKNKRTPKDWLVLWGKGKVEIIWSVRINEHTTAQSRTLTLCRDVWAVESAVLERLCTATYPGFESRSLRQFKTKVSRKTYENNNGRNTPNS